MPASLEIMKDFQSIQSVSVPIGQISGYKNSTHQFEPVFKYNGDYRVFVADDASYTNRTADTLCLLSYVDPSDKRPMAVMPLDLIQNPAID